MADYITTYTGVHFYPTEPDGTRLRIEDIAHALSLICRGNGHVRTFFSVGQHCINCAMEAERRSCSRRIVLACLLHDAGECYMSDVPRPFKKSLPKYREMEDRLLDVIYTRYLGSPLTAAEAQAVREIDDDMLWFDLKYLLNETPQSREPQVGIEICYDFIPFDEVERRYLEIFREFAIT